VKIEDGVFYNDFYNAKITTRRKAIALPVSVPTARVKNCSGKKNSPSITPYPEDEYTGNLNNMQAGFNHVMQRYKPGHRCIPL